MNPICPPFPPPVGSGAIYGIYHMVQGAAHHKFG